MNSSDIQQRIARLEKRIIAQANLVDAWARAIRAETRRFSAEYALQRLRYIRQRMARLPVIKKANPQLYRANTRFYLDELGKLIPRIRSIDSISNDRLAEALQKLQNAVQEQEDHLSPRDLQAIEHALAIHVPGLSPELIALLDRLQRESETDQEVRRRLFVAVAETMAARETEGESPPREDLFVLRYWMKDSLPEKQRWHRPPASILDIWVLSLRLARAWERYLLDRSMLRFDLHPDAAEDVEAALREQAIIILDRLERCENTTPEQVKLLRSSLAPLVKGLAGQFQGTSALLAFRNATLAIEPAARKALDALIDQVPAILAEMSSKLQSIAKQYETFASAFEKAFARISPAHSNSQSAFAQMTPFRLHAFELQAGPRAVEIAFRKLLFLRILHHFYQEPREVTWKTWQDWYGLQLLLLFDGINGFAKVTYRFNYHAKQRIKTVQMHARRFAQTLRAHARLLDALRSGAPLTFDFHAFMNQTRTTGYLDTLKQELELVGNAIAPSNSASLLETRKRILKSQLGRIALAETLLPELRVLKGMLETPSKQGIRTLAARTMALKKKLLTADLPAHWKDVSELFSLISPAQDNENEETGTSAAPANREAAKKLGELLENLEAEVVLPPIPWTKRANMRWQSPEAREYWGVRVLLENYDRRWLYRMRDAQLDLVRDLLAATEVQNVRMGRRRLAESYAAIVELRARQLASEQRRNRGIDYLQEDSGPALKLPAHIAKELFRGRRHRPPAQFLHQSENYYEKLLKDLSR